MNYTRRTPALPSSEGPATRRCEPKRRYQGITWHAGNLSWQVRALRMNQVRRTRGTGPLHQHLLGLRKNQEEAADILAAHLGVPKSTLALKQAARPRTSRSRTWAYFKGFL